MGYSYLVLGAGRQGTAAAYDLARFGEADRIVLADQSMDQASSSAARINQLTGREPVEALVLDARSQADVRSAIQGHTVMLSAVPYYFNLALTHAAIEAGVSFCDLGGNTGIVRQQHALDPLARQKGVRIVPDCGMGPGMGNTLAVYAMSLLDEAEHVYLYDGGLPLYPRPPWNYELNFHIEGLTNEYYGGMTVLRDGEIAHLACFTELEMIDFPPLGRLEAFIVAGGASTAPWTFRGMLKTYQLKILRYPGSFVQLKAFSDLGLFSPEPVEVDGTRVAPRKLFNALYEPQVRGNDPRDICLIQARVLGKKAGRPAEAVVELVDRFDEATGFTAMERTTGWHASIVAIMLARGETPVGALPLETAVAGEAFVRQARRRGFEIRERIS